MMKPTTLAFAALWVWSVAGCDGASGGDEDTTTDVGVEDTFEEVLDVVDTPEDTATPDTSAELECVLDSDCDDSDPCTSDSCDGDFGECEHVALDGDGDGYPADSVGGLECGGTDCDDGDASIHPDATTGCAEGDDLDCDTLPDRDEDLDGYITDACTDGDDCLDTDPTAFPGSTLVDCSDLDHDCNGSPDQDNDGDGGVRDMCGGDDCDDTDASIHFGGIEVECDGIDTDCNGSMSVVEDEDQDHYANAACAATGALVDCDDTDHTILPGATETCDEVDDDCDGTWADGGADDDGDTVLDAACGGADCDDTDPDYRPGSPAVDCSDLDHDCNGNADRDNDGDGHDREVCSGDDCDDDDDLIHPGAAPGCDVGDDFDCDTLSDPDEDEDGFIHLGCTGGDDCEDSRADAFPGAWEVCSDGVDQDCDTVADDTGVVMDPVMVSGTNESYGHAIEWTGTEFAVAWSGSFVTSDYIYLSRVAADGAVIGTDRRVTASTAHERQDPDMVWTGSELAFVWSDFDAAVRDVYFRRTDAVGNPLGSEVQITFAVPYDQQPRIAWSGSEYAVAWHQSTPDNQLFAVRVSAEGALLGSAVQLTEASPMNFSDLIWAGSGYAIAWNRSVATGNTEIFFARLSADGTKIGSDIMVTDEAGGSEYPALAWTGSEIALVWRDSRYTSTELMFARFTPEIVPVGSMIRITDDPYSPSYPDLVWTGSEIDVVYGQADSGGVRMFVARVGSDGTVIDPGTFLFDDPDGEEEPDLAWSGSTLGIIWKSDVHWFDLGVLCP